jgi:predicted chitinase/pyrimidine deaminase RibD-like protein/LysM repeat protein
MNVIDIITEKTFRGLGLVIFDIDDTLLHTTAKINVVKDGKVIRSLTNQEFNNYQLQPGEQFDFGEFRNAEKFAKESKPIKPMINKLKTILAHADKTRSKVIMLTARADFDDKRTVLKTFHDYGVDMSRIHLYRAGNVPGDDPPALKKAVYVREFLKSGSYNRVSLYDDSNSNLSAFKDLQKEFPHVRFSAYHVSPTGHATQVETTVNEKIGDVVQVVEPGDTVYSIARQNNLDPLELMKFNGFTNTTKLVRGQEVKIPPKAQGTPVATPAAPVQATPTPQKTAAVPTGQGGQPAPITGNPNETILRSAALKAGIKGKELAQFLAQCAHESANFSTLVEFGGILDFKKYDIKFNPSKAKELGNINPGDGARYKGRGFIQLTGRFNYKKAGEALGLPLEQKPQLVEKPQVAARTAIWYWKNRVRPNVDNYTDTRDVTSNINSGLRGLDQRGSYFNSYLQTMASAKPVKEDKNVELDLMAAFKDFLPLVMAVLKIDKLPPIKLVKDIPGEQPSFGGFNQDTGKIYLQITNRHPIDIFRTLAHELVHFKQDTEHKLDNDSGKTGSPAENEANATAGIVMRHFNKRYPQYLSHRPLIKEDVSDYEIHDYEKLDKILMLLCKMVIKGQKSNKDYGMVAAAVLDPDNQIVAKLNYPESNGKRVHAERAAMEAYTSKYGEIPKGSIIITTLSPCNEISDETADGRSGNNCTDLINNSTVRKVYCGYIDPSQGNEEHDERDFTLMETENGKIRDLCKSFADTFLDEDYPPDQPTGPETPPEMPMGTVKVDVSDVYDWYKLGQHISNLGGLGKHDFGKGPPQTVFAFGSEEEEHKYLKNLKRLGLKTHDIDPPGYRDVD